MLLSAGGCRQPAHPAQIIKPALELSHISYSFFSPAMVFLTASDQLEAVCVVFGTNLLIPRSVYEPCLGLWLDHHPPTKSQPNAHEHLYRVRLCPLAHPCPYRAVPFVEGLSVPQVKAFSLVVR